MIISSIIILLSSLALFSFPVQSFYITNTAVLEQCSTGPIIFSNKFDPTKMHCLNNIWRQVFIIFEYSCTNNILTRTWTTHTSINQGGKWPSEIFLLTGKDYVDFGRTSNTQDITIEDNSKTFDPNNNQLITYMWTSLSNGPQCRIRYPIINDICTTGKGSVGAKLTDFVCYYGQQTFNLITVTQRQAFDKLLDDSIKANINTLQNNPFNLNLEHNSQNNSNFALLNLNLSALDALKNLSSQKFKRYIIIGGIIVLVLILILIILVIFCCRRRSSNKDFEKRMSEDSNIE